MFLSSMSVSSIAVPGRKWELICYIESGTEINLRQTREIVINKGDKNWKVNQGFWILLQLIKHR